MRQQLGGIRPAAADLRLVAMLEFSLQRDTRKLRALQHLHIVGGDVDVELRGDDGRVVAETLIDRRLLRRRQVALDVVGRSEALRLVADHLLVDGDRTGHGGGGGIVVRQPRLQARIGLRHVRARALADIQPVGGGAHLLAQELDVLGPQIEHDLGPYDVHEGLHGVEQRLLLDVAQLRPRGADRVFRLRDGIGRAEAEEERHFHDQLSPARIEVARRPERPGVASDWPPHPHRR